MAGKINVWFASAFSKSSEFDNMAGGRVRRRMLDVGSEPWVAWCVCKHCLLLPFLTFSLYFTLGSAFFKIADEIHSCGALLLSENDLLWQHVLGSKGK